MRRLSETVAHASSAVAGWSTNNDAVFAECMNGLRRIKAELQDISQEEPVSETEGK